MRLASAVVAAVLVAVSQAAPQVTIGSTTVVGTQNTGQIEFFGSKKPSTLSRTPY